MRQSRMFHASKADRWLLIALLVTALTVISSAPLPSRLAAAQDDATPEAATPVPTTPEEARFARLGGFLADVQAEYGAPDWVDEGLIGYNSVALGGVDTITMVFYDAEERVRSYLLVYLEQPEALNDPDAVAGVVADVAPRDGACDGEALEESGLGEEVYACRSESLKGVYTADELLAFDVVGEDGSYSYSVNPTDDAYYEIAVRFGTDIVPEPAGPPPLPTPTPRPPLEEEYPPLADIGDLLEDDEFAIGQELSFAGTVMSVVPDLTGTVVQVETVGADGTVLWVSVVSDDDLVGITPGLFVEVYGLYGGTECDAAGACTPTVYVIELVV